MWLAAPLHLLQHFWSTGGCGTCSLTRKS
jgi:hypothetical protein